MTDVNSAVELLSDAQDELFDTAIIVSGDSDLFGPINNILSRFPEKRVIVAFPPRRFSKTLRNCATGFIRVSQNELKKSLFPTQIVKPDGHVLECPASWR